MALANAMQGARHTAQEIVWSNGGVAVDLTDAALSGFKRNVRSGVVTPLDGTLAATDAENGVFTWTYGEEDVAAPGAFSVQFLATFPDDSVEKTIPEKWIVKNSYDDEVTE